MNASPISLKLNRSENASKALVESLVRLGFTEYEARVYIVLARRGPSTAYEVAKQSNLPQANVYSTIRSLEAKAAIQPISDTPVRYVPVDPDLFFEEMGKKAAGLCASVANEIRRGSRHDHETYVHVVRGSDEIQAKARDLIDKAEVNIWIKAAEEHIHPLLEDLSRVAEGGVNVHLIAFGAELSSLDVHARVKVYPHEGNGVSYGAPARLMFVMVVDSSCAMVASHTHHPVGSYTRNVAIIYTIQTLLLHEIYLVEIFAKFGTQLDRHFGKGLAKLRSKYRPDGRERIFG